MKAEYWMVINLRKIVRPAMAIALLIAAAAVFWLVFGGKYSRVISGEESRFVLGGIIHKNCITKNCRTEYEQAQPVSERLGFGMDKERFQRPSKQPAFKLKYDFDIKDLQDAGKVPRFSTAENAVHAYYAILKEAENMNGYHGGCGTIGMAKTPYPFAYELLAPQTRQMMSLEEFVKSFSGIGHITLLNLYSAYQPADTPENTRYFVAEIEVITGPPVTAANKNTAQPSYFAYYYGLITVEKIPLEGWKIRCVDYVPEDFLCSPYHLWHWDARALVEIVYGEWYKLIEKIERIEKRNSIISVYASGSTGEYRFDFLRLTNGEDILLHEYIIEKGKLRELNLLKEEHQIYKFSILNPNLREN